MNQQTQHPCPTQTAAPDQTARARQLINAALAETGIDTLDKKTARLIAACTHNGAGSALHAFAATGTLDPTAILAELGAMTGSSRLWSDALTRFVENAGGDRHAFFG